MSLSQERMDLEMERAMYKYRKRRPGANPSQLYNLARKALQRYMVANGRNGALGPNFEPQPRRLMDNA